MTPVCFCTARSTRTALKLKNNVDGLPTLSPLCASEPGVRF